jgi:hypothetical protein
MIKPRRIRWAGNVGRMEEMRNAFEISSGKEEEIASEMWV